MKAGFDEVAGLFGVGEDLAVDGDGAGAVAGVFGEVGDFETEEEVVGILIGQTLLDDDGFGVAGVVAQEEGERGAGLDWRDDAVGSAVAEEVEAFLFVASYASDADEDADDARQAGYGELLDADGHLGVDVVGIELEGLLTVAAGGVALAGGGYVAVIGEGDEGGVHATSVAAGEVGVGVVWIGFDLAVAEGDGGVGERFDAVANVGGDGDVAFGGEEGVVGVVGGVEEVLTVELAEDEGLEDVAGRDGALGVGFLDGLEAGEGAFVVEVVEVLLRLANLGREVDGVGVVVSEGRRCQQECGKEEESFCAAFYCSSPNFSSRAETSCCYTEHFSSDADTEDRAYSAGAVLDA